MQDNWSDWFGAQKICSSQGGSLASITSQGLNDFLGNFASGYGDAWIGLKWSDSVSQWAWTDGSVLNYTNWFPSKYRFLRRLEIP